MKNNNKHQHSSLATSSSQFFSSLYCLSLFFNPTRSSSLLSSFLAILFIAKHQQNAQKEIEHVSFYVLNQMRTISSTIQLFYIMKCP